MKIPTNPMYDIDENAVVRLISTNEIIPEYRNRFKRRAVKIRGKSHKASSHPLDRLMLLTYKPLPEHKDPEWMSVLFRDGCRDNVTISNLEWSDEWWYPDPSLDIKNGITRWVPVYGVPILEVRILDGEVLLRNSKTHREIGYKIYVNYKEIIIPGGFGHHWLHRLVALTFLPHPLDTDHLTVNHKDSNKENNDPRNLEWATSTQNNFHAYSEGSRNSDIRKIVVKRLSDGNETIVSGFHEMARLIGTKAQTAHCVLERRTFEGRPYKGYVFKYEDDPRSWEELANSGPREWANIPEKIACRNMVNGEIKICSSFKELRAIFGFRPYVVRNLLNSKIIIPCNDICIQEYNGKPLKWPNYPEHILDVLRRTHATDKPIKVLDVKGNEKYYTSVTEWCNEDRPNRCDPAVLSRYMKKKEDSELRWRDWVFSYIDLSEYQ